MNWRSKVNGASATALLALGGIGCGSPDAPANTAGVPAVEFDTSLVRIESASDTFTITAEIAATGQQRAHGLMLRENLPDDHGMLFVYPELQDSSSAFYMFRTLIPLDIAFIDDDARIASIRSMEPCDTPNPSLCRRYPAGVPFRTALEVNRGFFERRGVAVGDRVVQLDASAATQRGQSATDQP